MGNVSKNLQLILVQIYCFLSIVANTGLKAQGFRDSACFKVPLPIPLLANLAQSIQPHN